MKNELIEKIKLMIEREGVENKPAESLASQTERLNNTIATLSQSYDVDERREIESAINSFIDSSPAQKRKLCSYCIDFVDPTVKPETFLSNGKEIQLNAFRIEDDFEKLYQFVKRHKADYTFTETLFNLMDKRGIKKNSQVYGPVYMRRQDFSRLINPKNYDVSKQTVWHIILGLKCSLEEADDLLFSAGYTRRKNTFDLILQYFIEHKEYRIMLINEVLEEFKQKPFSLASKSNDSDPF